MKKSLFILLYHFSKLNKVKIKNVKLVFIILNFLLTISTVNSFEYWQRLAPVPKNIKLGTDCKSSLHCLLYIANSQCSWDDRKCECQSYHIPNSNNTRCLPGVLLTYECEIDAQCELKVPNSICSNNKCVCKENHIKIRLDKCLTPASLGDYCLNDEMCSSVDIYSHCKWIVPRAYGKCKCKPDHFYAQDNRCYPRLGQQCFKNNDCQKYSNYTRCGMTNQKNTMIIVKASVRKHNKDKLLNKSKYSGRSSRLMSPFNTDNLITPKLTNTAKTGYRSISRQISRQSRLTKKFKDNQILNTCRCIAGYKENDNKTNCIKVEPKKTIQSSTQSPSILSPIASANNEHYILERKQITSIDQPSLNSSSLMPISIGKKCKSSIECKLRDEYSECTSDGICDCVNKNSRCSIQKTGCYPDTFQCNDGSCLSWYFVCDKQSNCLDDSDETACIRYNCPVQAFQCDDGYCISKGKLCNGIFDCADGSDEKGCKNEICPFNTFQCKSDKKCLPSYTFCNGIFDCLDKSDEDPNICELNQVCPSYSFQCRSNKKCRSTAITCSGHDGCEDGSDENNCTVCYCDKPI